MSSSAGSSSVAPSGAASPVIPGRRAPAAPLLCLQPLTATILSVAFLGSRLSPAGIAGAVLLGAAVLSAARPGD